MSTFEGLPVTVTLPLSATMRVLPVPLRPIVRFTVVSEEPAPLMFTLLLFEPASRLIKVRPVVTFTAPPLVMLSVLLLPPEPMRNCEPEAFQTEPAPFTVATLLEEVELPPMRTLKVVILPPSSTLRVLLPPDLPR